MLSPLLLLLFLIKFRNWVVSVISVLDIIQQMQLLPERCMSLHEPLRELLLPGRDESRLPDLEYAIGMEPDTPPPETVRKACEQYMCVVSCLLLHKGVWSTHQLYTYSMSVFSN